MVDFFVLKKKTLFKDGNGRSAKHGFYFLKVLIEGKGLWVGFIFFNFFNFFII